MIEIKNLSKSYVRSDKSVVLVLKNISVSKLQKRGVYPTSYKEGTLREKIFGYRYLPDNHPAAYYRDIEKVKKEEAGKK